MTCIYFKQSFNFFFIHVFHIPYELFYFLICIVAQIQEECLNRENTLAFNRLFDKITTGVEHICFLCSWVFLKTPILLGVFSGICKQPNQVSLTDGPNQHLMLIIVNLAALFVFTPNGLRHFRDEDSLVGKVVVAWILSLWCSTGHKCMQSWH